MLKISIAAIAAFVMLSSGAAAQERDTSAAPQMVLKADVADSSETTVADCLGEKADALLACHDDKTGAELGACIAAQYEACSESKTRMKVGNAIPKIGGDRATLNEKKESINPKKD